MSIVTSKEASHVHHTTDITASLVAFGLHLILLVAFLLQVEKSYISLTDVPENIRGKIAALGMTAKSVVQGLVVSHSFSILHKVCYDSSNIFQKSFGHIMVWVSMGWIILTW